jgi:hypothetical protein
MYVALHKKSTGIVPYVIAITDLITIEYNKRIDGVEKCRISLGDRKRLLYDKSAY